MTFERNGNTKTPSATIGQPLTDMFGNDLVPVAADALRQRYLIPPFSVLSSRDGDWQRRKRQWIALGIQSELGRDNGKEGEGLTWKGTAASFDYYRVKEGTRETTDTQGTSIFDPVLCELMYSWFCPKGGQIIDPFAGGSVRGIVATTLGYRYWGCDLSGKQVEANQEQALKICPDEIIRWTTGDAKKLLAKAPDADFIFTCPPYGDLEVYSDDPADLSTMRYDRFISVLHEIIGLACQKLRYNRFACIVVGDFRDSKGFYHNFVSDTIQGFQEAAVKLYNEVILVTPVGSLPIRITGQFEAGRKVGKTHQNVLVFYKGDPEKISSYFSKGDALIV